MPADYAITFFYYDDLAAAAAFYETTMGFKLVLDQTMARIYRIGQSSYFGIVDGNVGHLHHQDRSAVLLTIVSDDVEGYYQKLKAANVAKLTEIRTGPYCVHFFFEDPFGYAIEVQRFHPEDVARLFQ